MEQFLVFFSIFEFNQLEMVNFNSWDDKIGCRLNDGLNFEYLFISKCKRIGNQTAIKFKNNNQVHNTAWICIIKLCEFCDIRY